MAEKNLILDGLQMHYEGIFSVDELFKTIDKYASEKGYSKVEKRRKEIITPNGKELSIELRPTKTKTEYLKLMIKIRIKIINLKDVIVIRDKRKEKLNQGNITMILDRKSVV